MFGNVFDENYNDVYFYLGGLKQILSEEYCNMLQEEDNNYYIMLEEENNKYYDELLDYYDSYYDDYNDY